MTLDAVSIVRRFYDAVRRSDVPSLLGLMHSEIEWTEAERFPYHAGTWRTPQAVVEELLVPLGRDWSAFSVTPTDYVAEGRPRGRVWYLFRHL